MNINLTRNADLLLKIPYSKLAREITCQGDVTLSFGWQKVAVMDAAEPRHQVKPHCTVSFEVGELVGADLVTQVTSNHPVVLQRKVERAPRAPQRTAASQQCSVCRGMPVHSEQDDCSFLVVAVTTAGINVAQPSRREPRGGSLEFSLELGDSLVRAGFVLVAAGRP
jgi:hypothetical protein